MRRLRSLSVGFLTLLGVSTITLAGPTVDEEPLGPDGQIFAGSISPKGEHMAVLAAKGSHYAIIMDGVEGPKVDGLIVNVAGEAYRPATYWSPGPIPVIFSKDGAHWAYMAKQGDDFVVMLDGKELARGPINTRNQANNLNLTFSAYGQHMFWSDSDAQGNFVIVVNGKPAPPMRYLPQLVLSPDGNHVYWISSGNLAVPQGVQGTKDSIMLFVDGKPAMHYTDGGTFIDPLTDTWGMLHPEFSADGTMSFIARTDEKVRRFHVKSDTDLGALLAAAPAAKAN